MINANTTANSAMAMISSLVYAAIRNPIPAQPLLHQYHMFYKILSVILKLQMVPPCQFHNFHLRYHYFLQRKRFLEQGSSMV